MKCSYMIILFLLMYDVSGVGSESESVSVSVMKGDSVTLYSGIEANKQEMIRWYFNDSLITIVTGDKREICTNDVCKERFRDRLKLDQTGSLTITDTRNTDSGEYHLMVFNSVSEKIFSVSVHVSDAAERDDVGIKSVKEGESVVLDPGVVKNLNDVMRWYFNDTLIAEITGDQSEICADDQCKERFRDRLQLDQTGSLTITDTRNTDSGLYQLVVFNSGSISDKIFIVSVHDAAERDDVRIKSVKEGESVVLDPGEIKNLNDVMRWYFKDTVIAEITGDQRKICADDECKERFRDRLKLDQTGSLTITDTRNTDSGEYKLHINNSSFSINRISAVLTVIVVPGSGLSPAAVAGIVVGVVLLIIDAVAAVFIYKWKKTQTQRDEENPLGDEPPDQCKTLLNANHNETSGASKNSVSDGDREC